MANAALTLADRFRISRGEPILVDNTAVLCVFRQPVTGPSVLRIRRVRTSSPRLQALRIAAAVDMTVNGVVSRDLTFRTDTAPTRGDIVVHAVDNTSIYIWNTWTTNGTEQAWLGNAGIVAELDLDRSPNTVRLRCSHGIGPANFDDLVVEVATDVWDPAAWDSDAEEDQYGDWPIAEADSEATAAN